MQVGVLIDAVRIERSNNHGLMKISHTLIDSRVSGIMVKEMVGVGGNCELKAKFEHSSEELILGDVIKAPIYPKRSIRTCEHA